MSKWTRNQQIMLEWLGAKEEKEPDSKDFLKIVTEMADFICGKLCSRLTDEQKKSNDLPTVCLECEMGEFACRLLNQNEGLKNFQDTQIAKIMQQYSAITFCEDCEYRRTTELDGKPRAFCGTVQGISGALKPGSGCSRGKKRVKE